MADDRNSVVLTTRHDLIDVLVAHQRASLRACGCGWDGLGRSFADHVADKVQEVDIAR